MKFKKAKMQSKIRFRLDEEARSVLEKSVPFFCERDEDGWYEEPLWFFCSLISGQLGLPKLVSGVNPMIELEVFEEPEQ